MKEEIGVILENQELAKDTYKMIIRSSCVKDMKPGQFVNIKVEGYMLRRPISISAIHKDSFTIVYKVVGDGTKKLATMPVNQTIEIFGPLGSSYPMDITEEEVLIIGGGVGVPPLYELAKQYRQLHKNVIVVLGFNDSASVFYEEEFKALGCETYVATMDGSYGTCGTVMDAIAKHHITCDFVCSCGPRPMLKAIEAKYTKGYMSFEARMACGMGACMACVARDKKEENMYHRICKEGPVFPIGKVEF